MALLWIRSKQRIRRLPSTVSKVITLWTSRQSSRHSSYQLVPKRQSTPKSSRRVRVMHTSSCKGWEILVIRLPQRDNSERKYGRHQLRTIRSSQRATNIRHTYSLPARKLYADAVEVEGIDHWAVHIRYQRSTGPESTFWYRFNYSDQLQLNFSQTIIYFVLPLHIVVLESLFR